MTSRDITTPHARDVALAEAVRDALARAAADAYEDAGLRGLCDEGRWECAVAAMRAFDVTSVVVSQAAPARPALDVQER